MKRILHFADVHGDKETLEQVVKYTQEHKDNIDVVTFSGDMLGICLPVEKGQQVNAAYSFLRNFINQHVEGAEDVPLDKVLGQVRLHPKCPDEVQKAIQVYEDINDSFEENAEKQYKDLASLFEDVPQEKFAVPGNWDSQQFFDYFGRYCVHKNKGYIEDESVGDNKISIAGFGEAPEGVVVIPGKQTIGFNEREMFDFLTEQDPDIALTHVPPYGFLNDVKNGGNTALLAYMSRESPELILCGHCHKARGTKIDKLSRTVVVNPGNLGRYPSVEKHEPNYGTFALIGYEKDGKIEVRHYSLNDGEFQPEAEQQESEEQKDGEKPEIYITK
jgi:Icc-related predicted phosphoesterase